MKTGKKVLSLVLALATVAATSLSTAVFAEDEDTQGTGGIIYVGSSDSEKPDGSEENPYTDLQEAVNAAKDGDTVQLLSGIAVSKTVTIKKSITIDGSLSGSEQCDISAEKDIAADPSIGGKNHVLQIVNASNVTIENLHFDGRDVAQSDIHVYHSSNIRIENVMISGAAGAGIIVNQSKVTLGGEIDLQDNAWGGINIDPQGKADATKLTFGSDAAVKMEADKTHPAIWVDLPTCESGDYDPESALEAAQEFFNESWKGAFVPADDSHGPQVWYTQSEASDGTTYYVDAFKGNDGNNGDSSEEPFKTIGKALESAEDGDTVKLLSDIKTDATISITKPIVLDGNNRWISVSSDISTKENGSNSVLMPYRIKGDASEDSSDGNLVIQNLKVNGTNAKHGINVFECSKVILKDVSVEEAKGAGVNVDSSEVWLEGTIRLNGNLWGGVNVSYGSAPSQDAVPPKLVLKNDEDGNVCKIKYVLKQGTAPIWVDLPTLESVDYNSDSAITAGREFFDEDGWVGKFIQKESGNGQVAYFPALCSVENDSEERFYLSLDEAIANASKGDTINLLSVAGLDHTVKIDKPVTIEGNDHTLSFTDALNTGNNGERNGLLIGANGVTVQNLAVTMDAAADTAKWEGVYGIQVYNATGVTLKNVSASGGDGGILVNGSAVSLEGNIDVSGNEFGGIEVSKGENLSKGPSLSADGAAFTNDTEAYGLPTIWEDGVTGCVTAPKSFTQITKEGQPQYYISSKNAVEPQIISKFADLNSGIKTQRVSYSTPLSSLILPKTLGTTVNGNAADLAGITWTSNPVYNPTEAGTYTFTAVLPEGYKLEKGVSLPTITVTVERKSSGGDSGNNGSHNSNPSPGVGGKGSETTTTTNAAGGTVATVTTKPDTAPLVTEGKSAVTVTVPSDVASVVATATAQKPAEVRITPPADELEQQLRSAEVSSVSLTIQVPSALANNTNENATVTIRIDREVLQQAKSEKKDITIAVTDAQTGREIYSWTFGGAALSDSVASVTNVDLALTVSSVQRDASANAIVTSAVSGGTVSGVLLEFADNGLLPARASLRVFVGQNGYAPNTLLYGYYLNRTTNALEQLPGGPLTVDANGYVTFGIVHCSDYVLLPKAAKSYPVTCDTNAPVGVKVGKTYMFEITVAGKYVPSFAVGNSKVFTSTLKKLNGKYYFTVKAVGRPGEMTALYCTLPGQKGTVLGYLKVLQ